MRRFANASRTLHFARSAHYWPGHQQQHKAHGDRLKTEPKQATAQNTRDFLDQLEWLREHAVSVDIFAEVPDVKVKQFAAEARSLDLGSIHDCAEPKRLTLTAALVVVQIARALDDADDMFVRLVQKLHNHAYDALLQHQADHVERTDSLVSTLRDVTLAYRTEGTAEERLNAIGTTQKDEETTGSETNHREAENRLRSQPAAGRGWKRGAPRRTRQLESAGGLSGKRTYCQEWSVVQSVGRGS